MKTYTFIPIDLETSLEGKNRLNDMVGLLTKRGWKQISGDAASVRKHDTTIMLMRVGIAVVILKCEFSSEHAVDFCERRYHVHHLLSEGDYSLLPQNFVEDITELRNTARSSCPKKERRSSHAKIFRYAFTAVSLASMPKGKDLYAILGPSLIGYGDHGKGELDNTAFNDGFGKDLSITDEIKAGSFAIRTHLSPSCVTVASWSTLLVVGATPDQMDFIVKTEAMIQTAWLAAWLSQSMAEDLLTNNIRHVNADAIHWQCLEFQGMEYWNEHRIDPSESEAHAHFRESLENTSGLQHEWSIAKRAMDRAEELARLVQSERDSYREALLNVLLLLLSIASLVQVLFAVPLQRISDFTSHPWPLAAVIAFTVAGIVLILRTHH